MPSSACSDWASSCSALRLNLETVFVIGAGAFGLVIVGMVVALTFALLVGRMLRIPRRVAVLIGVGTAVCGNSAIIAAAPVVKADDREVSFAVTTITVFGTLAVFLYPFIGHALQLDVLTFGLWAGTAVHDTAQTIAASAAYSTIGRDVATVVKLVRNALMAPLLLLIAWGWTRFGEQPVVGEPPAAARARPFRCFCSASWPWPCCARHTSSIPTPRPASTFSRACASSSRWPAWACRPGWATFATWVPVRSCSAWARLASWPAAAWR